MCIMDEDTFDYQIINLTKQFYIHYSDPPYTEIARKGTRPYSCLLIQSSYDYFICIPYRSHIKHKYSYRFRHSVRSKINESGLDYSKLVIIKNSEYIGTSDAIIDSDEYKETRDKIDYIKKDVQEYIREYVECITDKKEKYDKRRFQRKYGYSTLKYFHEELGISKALYLQLEK